MSRCFNFILLSKNSAKGSDRRPTFLPFVEFVYIVVITIYLIWSLPDALICKVSKNFANGHYEIEEIELKATEARGNRGKDNCKCGQYSHTSPLNIVTMGDCRRDIPPRPYSESYKLFLRYIEFDSDAHIQGNKV